MTKIRMKLLLLIVLFYSGKFTVADIQVEGGLTAVSFVCDDGLGFSGSLDMNWVNEHIQQPYDINFVGMDGVSADSYCPINTDTGAFDGTGTFGKCARKSLKSDTPDSIKLQYMIRAMASSTEQMISRQSGGLTLTFECEHGSASTASLNKDVSVNTKKQAYDAEMKEGEFPLDFVKLGGGPVYANVAVNFRAKLTKQTVTVMSIYYESCWVTEEKDPNATPRHTLIEDNCRKDTTTFMTQGRVDSASLKFEAFKWLDKPDAPMWLHCKIRTCYGTCKEECAENSLRRRRSIESSAASHVIKSAGPFHVIDQSYELGVPFKKQRCDPVTMGCDHACDGRGGAHCVCMSGYQLADDQKTCQLIPTFWGMSAIAWTHAFVSWSILMLVVIKVWKIRR